MSDSGVSENSVRALAQRFPLPERAAIETAAPRLALFLSLLLRKNENMNLVSARSAEPDVLVGTHLKESLEGLALLPPPGEGARGGERLRLLDLGSGGGFPAIPLLIVRDDIDGTLVDSSRKKTEYLAAIAAPLALTARILNARFPDSFDMSTQSRAERYDVLTTRAVSGAGSLVGAARPRLALESRALLWTTRPLVAEAARESGAKRHAFHPSLGTDARGILFLECFT